MIFGDLIVCEECGYLYRPLSDSYKCPVCGVNNYPQDDEDGK